MWVGGCVFNSGTRPWLTLHNSKTQRMLRENNFAFQPRFAPFACMDGWVEVCFCFCRDTTVYLNFHASAARSISGDLCKPTIRSPA